MSRCLSLCVLSAAAALAAAAPPDGERPRYAIESPDNVLVTSQPLDGRNALFVTLRFRIRDTADGRTATDIAKDEIVVEEDGLRVAGVEITAPAVEPLQTVLALDVSGSMSAERKWAQAREAAHTFLNRLDPRTDSGLILFNHAMRVREAPAADRAAYAAHRDALRRHIDAAEPGGGTAYLDAAALGVDMLRDVPGRRAVVLMTDGVDMNSRRRLDEVVRAADAAKVPVYTLGIGEPGRNEPVTTVLVLDRSQSMSEPANDRDTVSKMEALHTAAGRFVDLMRPNARTSLLAFNHRVGQPGPFTDDKAALKRAVERLRPDGGTRLFDAVFAGVRALADAGVQGRKAVVVLTDGKEEGRIRSEHPVREVISEARDEGVALYLLGLGSQDEIDEPVMQRMAEETRGKYLYAGDSRRLIDLFEQLCIDLHDDGIDEGSLRALAEKTGGRYLPARDVSKLNELFGSLADELQSTYTVTFPSRRPSHDGTARGIEVRVVRGGVQVSDVARAGYQVHGVVVPEMDSAVYLTLLLLLGALLAAPAVVRRLTRPAGKPTGP